MMQHKEQQGYNNAVDFLANDLQSFIELSFHEDETSIDEWISKTGNKIEGRCWEKKQCKEDNCPAYQNENGRCWLIAGTMCDGEVQGKFAQKFKSCTECNIFKETIGDDQICKLKEFVIVLVHSLLLKKANLQEALDKIQTLEGFLPICCYCKKIRDDEGYWNQLEAYIASHSKAKFSHGICEECMEKHYPDIKN